MQEDNASWLSQKPRTEPFDMFPKSKTIKQPSEQHSEQHSEQPKQAAKEDRVTLLIEASHKLDDDECCKSLLRYPRFGSIV